MIVCANLMITNRGERNFQPLIQRGRDSMEHGEGVALIVGVFESSYNGLFGADELRELLLCQPSFGSSLVNEPGNVSAPGPLLEELAQLCVGTGHARADF